MGAMTEFVNDMVIEDNAGAPPAGSVVRESGLIKAPIGNVWGVISKMDFKWNPNVLEVTAEADGSAVDSSIVLQYDGSMETVSIRGVNCYDYTATWEMIAAEPQKSYSGVRYSVHLEPVTLTNETVVIFTTYFSSDAKIGVLEDQKY